MGFGDRQYSGGGYGGGGDFLAGSPVTKGLVIANVAVFLANFLIRSLAGVKWGSFLDEWGPFTIAEGVYGLQLWRFVTFQFLHGDLFHLLFNMYALATFGPLVERWWRSRPFLVFYLVCGVAGALFFTLLWALPGVLEGVRPYSSLVGASAGIFGILIATAVIAPEGRVMLLIPPVPMKMRTFAILILGFGIFMVVVNGRNAGGEAGHLGGALAGFLLMVVSPLRKLIQSVDGAPRLRSWP